MPGSLPGRGKGVALDNRFLRSAAGDSTTIREGCRQPKRGIHRFLRVSHTATQRRFAELYEPTNVPVAFLHGNPHLDNYVKTPRGAAMVDFDRARLGPYVYDTVRFLLSVSLRRAARDRRLLHPVVLESYRRGYLFGASGVGTEEVVALKKKRPKKWQRSTRAYIRSNKVWAERLGKYAVDADEPYLYVMLASYLESRSELEVLDTHFIEAAAVVPGSMGKKHTLLLLTPHDDGDDQRLLDVKEVYDEPDDAWFTNPYPHNGQRMVEAGELHAPGWEIRPGYATFEGVEYWCREVPTQQVKLKRPLTEVEQVDVCFAVGSQLGRAHRLSMDGISAEAHLADFTLRFDNLVDVASELRRELEVAYVLYIDEAERLGPKRLQKTG